jgi:DNA-binding transcriptional ArsR family regulator
MSSAERAAASVFFALGDGTRLALVRRLGASGALSATTLTDGTDISRQAISKHLKVLEGAGLVSAARRGREVVYALEPERLGEARDFLAAVSARWDRALERLRRLVEEPSERPRDSGRPLSPRKGARRRA